MTTITQQFNNSTPVQKALLRDRIRIITKAIFDELLAGTDLINHEPAYDLAGQAYDLLNKAGNILTEDYDSQIKDIIKLYEAESQDLLSLKTIQDNRKQQNSCEDGTGG